MLQPCKHWAYCYYGDAKCGYLAAVHVWVQNSHWSEYLMGLSTIWGCGMPQLIWFIVSGLPIYTWYPAQNIVNKTALTEKHVQWFPIC